MRVPSTQALRALESFARLGTVWQAADEMHVTRSAISHQLRMLERDLDFHLFDRIGTRIELTSQGRAYAADIRQALLAISGSAARNAKRGISGALTVSCAPGFASGWLCNKIGRFTATYPEVTLSIVTPRRLGEVTNPDADLFITFGSRDLVDMEVEHLQDVVSTPVCSPALLNRLAGRPDPADVLRLGLLHLTDAEDWTEWFHLVAIPANKAQSGITFSDMHLVYSAALAGQGIAMGDIVLCEDALIEGRLVRPFQQVVRLTRAYHLAVPKSAAGNPVVAAFAAWMRAERAQSPVLARI